MRRFTSFRWIAAAFLAGAVFAAPVRSWAQAPATDSGAPLRVCADPDNLPFSSSKSGHPGLYIEIAQKIADMLGRPMQETWSLSYFGKHTVRDTLLSRHCDLFVGLPRGGFMGQSLIMSRPFLHIGYALMVPAGMHVGSLNDLAGKRVAVQYSSTPQMILAGRDDITSVTFLNPEDAARALADRKVDAAFIWGPSAGYINATALNHAYDVIPIDGDGMQFPVAIAFNRTDTELRSQVDRFIEQNAALISQLAEKYGLPTAVPVKLSSAAAFVVLRGASDAPAASNDMVAEGREIFNGTCSHCHGPDAEQSVKKIDLRLLHHRYGDDMETVFHTTVTHGRPAKGMPNWSGVFSEDDFKKIFAFLRTVQTPDR